MNLRNYTSSVPVINSISKIEFKLVKAGALHIAKSYSKDRADIPIGMKFQLVDNRLYELPANVDKVYNFMLMQRKNPPTDAQAEQLRSQAQRTAWKNLSDWVDILTSLTALDQVEVEEAFFPYLYDGKRNNTLYHILKENNFKLLEGGK